jgi:outer membrane beta-barrel protein
MDAMTPIGPRGIAVFLAVSAMILVPEVARAADDQPTIQDRFAVKENSIYGRVSGLTHLRNDFYSTFGFGVDVGYYPFESFGAELRVNLLDSSLNDAALDLKDRTGLTPDAQPQNLMLLGGARWSFGYGKILLLDSWVAHFDPQLAVHGGVALAETRILPTFLVGPGLIIHFAYGIHVTVDLPVSVQVENRDRGSVTSVGFIPSVGVGWSWSFGGAP